MLMLVGGGIYGFDLYQKRQVLQRADSSPVVADIAEKEPAVDPQQPKQATEDKGLADTIQKKLDTMPKNTQWSVSVRDLKSERMANVNADTSTEAASLFKLFLLPSLEKKLSADNWKVKLGGKTTAACVEAMIKVSDNDCAVAVGGYINWKSIDDYNRGLGFTATTVNSKTVQTTTSREVSQMLYRLQNSQILSDKARRIVFDALYEQKYRSGIPAGCGQECLVGNKTGENGPVKHDAAVVTHGASQYIVVIMSTNASWAQVADVAHTVDLSMLP